MKARILGVGAVFLATFVPSPSRAADAEADAEKWVVSGVDRYNHEDYEGARAAFGRAFELSPNTRTLFNLALAEVQSEHFVESARHMRAYLAELEAEPDKVIAIQERWLPRAEAHTSRLQVEAPGGAEVRVDGHVEGRAPLPPVDVTVGAHDVTSQSGPWSRRARVVTGPGELLVVRFDDRGRAGMEAAGTPAPRYELPRPRGSTGRLVATVVLGSAALVAAGAAIAWMVISNDEASEATELLSQLPPDPSHSQCLGSTAPPQCPRLQADNRAAQTATGVSNGFFIGAGVLAGAAVVTALFWPSRASAPLASSVLHIVPLAAEGGAAGAGAGLELRGTW